MICPICIRQQRKSRTTQITGYTSTVSCDYVRKWDEEGQQVFEQKGVNAWASYECSNGHKWQE